MSDELKAFYRAYRDWLDAGAPDGKPFVRFDGLCGNVRHLYTGPENEELRLQIRREMAQQFRDAGLNSVYPFDARSYQIRLDADSQHRHKPRIEWVRKHAE